MLRGGEVRFVESRRDTGDVERSCFGCGLKMGRRV